MNSPLTGLDRLEDEFSGYKPVSSIHFITAAEVTLIQSVRQIGTTFLRWRRLHVPSTPRGVPLEGYTPRDSPTGLLSTTHRDAMSKKRWFSHGAFRDGISSDNLCLQGQKFPFYANTSARYRFNVRHMSRKCHSTRTLWHDVKICVAAQIQVNVTRALSQWPYNIC